MKKYTVDNPTGKSKAVREAGGLTIIKPGKKATVEADWSEAEIARYEAAGLKLSEAKAKPATTEKQS